jgi:hypothetical protein
MDREDDDCIDLTNWSLGRKEKTEKHVRQLEYFADKIRNIKNSITPHFEGHTYIDTEECRRKFEEHEEILQRNFRRLDCTLTELEHWIEQKINKFYSQR